MKELYMQKSKSLLVSAIIGVVFIGLLVWGFIDTLEEIGRQYRVIQEGFSRSFLDTLFWFYAIFAFPILLIAATVFNFLGRAKDKRKNVLIAGILYILSLNFPSAIICFVAMRKKTA
jgi:hypothetical protein